MTREWINAIVTVALAFAVYWSGYATGARTTRNKWRDEIVARGFGKFHWASRKFYWEKDGPKPEWEPKDPAVRKVRDARAVLYGEKQ